PQPQLAFRPAGAGALETGREIALKALLGERPAVAQQAQADLPTGDDGAAARRIARRAGERCGDRVLTARQTRRATDGDEGCAELHPKTSPVIVRNHASARTASAARAPRGASLGLTPPAPGMSASCPPLGT